MNYNKGFYDFIEIGTSDFDTLVETACPYTKGISLDPIQTYLNNLPSPSNVLKLPLAISNQDGETELYYIPEESIEKYNLKWWVRGSNSIGKPHSFTLKDMGKEMYEKLVKVKKIPTLSLSTLFSKYEVNKIRYFKIDTEGHDYVILKEYLKLCKSNPSLLADIIHFEYHQEVSNIEILDELIQEFKGYNIEKNLNKSEIKLYRPQIPKIIHQTFKTKNLPKDIQFSINQLKSQNPSFEYRFYDDEDCIKFIQDHYPKKVLDLYFKIPNKFTSARADLFRYLLMYKIGGVYLDIKSSTTSPLENTLIDTDEYLLTHWPGKDWKEEIGNSLGEFQNWHIVCRPFHPFLTKTIEDVLNNLETQTISSKSDVLRITGPIAYSKAINELIKYPSHQPISVDSSVREYMLEHEIGLKYLNLPQHHRHYYNSYNE